MSELYVVLEMFREGKSYGGADVMQATPLTSSFLS